MPKNEIRDETTVTNPDVWLVWDDSDYYGPHLQTVEASRADAVAYIEQAVATKSRARRDLYVDGVRFGDIDADDGVRGGSLIRGLAAQRPTVSAICAACNGEAKTDGYTIAWCPCGRIGVAFRHGEAVAFQKTDEIFRAVTPP